MAETYRICGVRETDPGQTASADSTLHVDRQTNHSTPRAGVRARAAGRSGARRRARRASIRETEPSYPSFSIVAACTPFFGTV